MSDDDGALEMASADSDDDEQPVVDAATFEPAYIDDLRFEDDEPGERWAAHPFYDPKKVVVSTSGRVGLGARTGLEFGEYFVTKGHKCKLGYCKVNIHGKSKKLHDLVCMAFLGPKPTPAHTPDHENRIKDDNHLTNLSWKTNAEQRANQKKRRPSSLGKPVEGHRRGTQEEWVRYASAYDAQEKTGIARSTIGKVCHGKAHSAGGYTWRWAPPVESQEPLPQNEKDPRPEEWKLAPNNGGRLWISTRGRVQTKDPIGDGWSHRHTPIACEGQVYAAVKYQGRLPGVHQVVWITFRPEHPLVGDETIDHIDQDESNNCLYNLRPLSRSGQSRNQTRMPSTDQNVVRIPVRGWPRGHPELMRHFASTCDAVEQLKQDLPQHKWDQGGISQSMDRGIAHQGWRFERDETPAAKRARDAQRFRNGEAVVEHKKRKAARTHE